MQSNNLTLETICESLSLWLKHIDIAGLNTQQAFESMPYEARLDIVESIYSFQTESFSENL